MFTFYGPVILRLDCKGTLTPATSLSRTLKFSDVGWLVSRLTAIGAHSAPGTGLPTPHASSLSMLTTGR